MMTAVSISTGSVLGGVFLLGRIALIGKDGRSFEAFIYAQLSGLKTRAREAGRTYLKQGVYNQVSLVHPIKSKLRSRIIVYHSPVAPLETDPDAVFGQMLENASPNREAFCTSTKNSDLTYTGLVRSAKDGVRSRNASSSLPYCSGLCLWRRGPSLIQPDAPAIRSLSTFLDAKENDSAWLFLEVALWRCVLGSRLRKRLINGQRVRDRYGGKVNLIWRL